MKVKREKRKFKKIIILSIILIIFLIGMSVYVDIQKNDKIKSVNNGRGSSNIEKLLKSLVEGNDSPPFYVIDSACASINNRMDCADFSTPSLLRIMYDYYDEIPDEYKQKIKSALLGFKYWMDQPGDDSMCFWSENHQILFAQAEYLAGNLYPEEIFANDGKTGEEHAQMAKDRILIWLENRWKYGFSEWYSNVYYVYSIGALANLIDFAEDIEISEKSKMIMDLYLYDIATQSYNGIFISTSGRMYDDHKKDNSNNKCIAISQMIWGYNPNSRLGIEYNLIISNKYEVPEVIKEIGYDKETVVLKSSMGLELSELKDNNLIGLEERQIMTQWGMEAFTNPQVISNSIKYIDKNGLFTNKDLNDFKLINITILKNLNLLGLVSKILNPFTNGLALQRANTYTYKTKDYMLATAQGYHAGEYGTQEHIWSAVLNKDVCIFTTHPACLSTDNKLLDESPGYWIGNGRMPYSVQDKNINMSIYKIPNKKGFLENKIVNITHAYFPKSRLDDVLLENNYVFGSLNDVYVAFTAKNNLTFNRYDDLIQEGSDVYWIFEISTKEKEGSFENFIDRIKSNKVTYENNILKYESDGRILESKYNEFFKVNNEKIDLSYKRYDSPYAQTDRESEIIIFEFNNKKLILDFYNIKRVK